MGKIGPYAVVSFSKPIALGKEFFAHSEATYRVSFNEQQRKELRDLCTIYSAVKNSLDNSATNSEVSAVLEKIKKDLGSLIRALNVLNSRSPASRAANQRLGMRLENIGIDDFPCGLLSQLHILSDQCKKELLEIKQDPSAKRGRGKNWFLDGFIDGVANLYRQGGGHPAAHNRTKDGKSQPGGPFVRFMCDVMSQLPNEVRLSDRTLASRIHDRLHGRPKSRGKKRKK